MKNHTGCVRMEAMSIEQQRRIREAARSIGLREYVFITFCLSHCVRAGEFSDRPNRVLKGVKTPFHGLRVSDVDLENNQVTIRRQKKSNDTTESLLPQEIPALREWLAVKPAGDLLFPNMSRQTAYRIVRECAEKAALPRNVRGHHALRHSLAQAACDAGLSLPELLKLGGWKTSSSALRYFEAKQGMVDSKKANALSALFA